MPRLLSHVLEHLGFSEEPRIERRQRCPQILSLERTLSMPLSFLLHQQKEVEDDFAEDLPGGEQPVPVVEVERNSVPDSSPSVPPPTAPAPTDSCHGRVSGINKICIRSSSYCRSQATAA